MKAMVIFTIAFVILLFIYKSDHKHTIAFINPHLFIKATSTADLSDSTHPTSQNHAHSDCIVSLRNLDF